MLYGTSITNISGHVNGLSLCCAAVLYMPRSCQGQSPASMCGDRNFLAPLYRTPILSPCPISPRTPRPPCPRLPFQVYRHPGSNRSLIMHCKTTPNKRESTSLNTTSPISSNAAVPPMRSSCYSETRRRSLKNIETEIAS